MREDLGAEKRKEKEDKEQKRKKGTSTYYRALNTYQ